MATTLIGLDGSQLDLTEATTLCGGSHGLGNISGYKLRQTSLTGGAHTDIAEFEGDTSFWLAVQQKGKLIGELGYGASGQYAVIDCLYACGCRGMG